MGQIQRIVLAFGLGFALFVFSIFAGAQVPAQLPQLDELQALDQTVKQVTEDSARLTGSWSLESSSCGSAEKEKPAAVQVEFWKKRLRLTYSAGRCQFVGYVPYKVEVTKDGEVLRVSRGLYQSNTCGQFEAEAKKFKIESRHPLVLTAMSGRDAATRCSPKQVLTRVFAPVELPTKAYPADPNGQAASGPSELAQRR